MHSLSLVAALAAKGSGWDAPARVVAACDAITSSGGVLDPHTLSALVSAHGRAGRVDAAFAAVAQASIGSSWRVAPDVFVLNALVAACCRSGDIPRARAVLRAGADADGLSPDAASFGPLVQALSKRGSFAEAADEYEAATGARGVAPSPRLLSLGVAAAGRAGQHARARVFFDAALARGVAPDAACFTALVSSCGADADAAAAACLEAERRGVILGADEKGVCAMLGVLSKAGDVDRAVLFFESIRRHWRRRTPPRSAYLLLRDAASAAGDTEIVARVVGAMISDLGGAAGASRPGAPADKTSRVRRAAATFSAEGRVWVTRNGEAEAGEAEEAEAEAEEAEEAEDTEVDAPDAETRVDPPPCDAAGGAVGDSAEEEAGGDESSVRCDARDDPHHPASTAAQRARLLAGSGPELVARLGDAYVPDLSCVLTARGGDAAAQRSLLASHAEKKALGAMLIRARRGAGGGDTALGSDGSAAPAGGDAGPYRIAVNIRMCRDVRPAIRQCCLAALIFIPLLKTHANFLQCHACFALASEKWAARIEVDDGHTHVFVGGVCSCGGRWR